MSHMNVEHCQCGACVGGLLHSSDCAVHNMSAYPDGPCSCGAIRCARKNVDAAQLHEICALTVDLIKLRQKECAHLCIENVAPTLFGGLLREFLL